MTKLIPSDLVKVRDNNGQLTELYLAKYKPAELMSTSIDDASIETRALSDEMITSITYGGPTIGNYLDVRPGSTLSISVDRGDRVNQKRVRIRGITSDTISVAPDSAIEYKDGQVLRIYDHHEFWPVFPRAVLNTGSLTYTLYKDYDIALSDQNTDFDPVVIMGPHFAGFYDTFSDVYFTATGSYTVDGSTISSYLWTFPVGSSPTGSTLGTPGNVTFPSSGHYTVSCTVTASNGKTATGYRHIVLLDRYAGDKDKLPIFDWEFKGLEGEWRGSYLLKIKIRDRVDEFQDGDLVILFGENYYQGIKQSFGGYPGREHIMFVGYISDIRTTYNAFDSEAEITVRGITNYMTNKEMFSIEMTDKETPTDWTEINNLTINKAINHYFRWHSTLLEVADVLDIPTYEGDYRENYIQIEKGEIFPTIDGFLNQRVFGGFSSDKQGRCYAEVDFNLRITGSRAATSMSFEDSDWLGSPVLLERFDTPLSDVLVGGEAYDPPTVTGTALLSRAPGALQTYVGKSENVSGLTLVSQNHVNELSGLYFAKENARYPELELELSNNMLNIDVAPQEFYGFSLTGTHRGLTWRPRLLPRKIDYVFEDFILKSTIVFEPETYGSPGTTIIIPVEVPDDCEDCTECPFPPCDDEENPEPPPGTEADGNLVYVCTRDKLGRTRNFLNASPTWENITPSLSGNIVAFEIDPWNPNNRALIITTNGVYRTTNLDDSPPTFSLVLSPSTVQTATGKVDLNFRNCCYTITQNEKIYVAWASTTTGFAFGVSNSADNGATWSHVFIDNHSGVGVLSPIIPRMIGGLDGTGKAYMCVGNYGSRNHLCYTTNGGVSWTLGHYPGVLTDLFDFDVSYPDAANTVIYYREATDIRYSHGGIGGAYSTATTLAGTAGAVFGILINIATADRDDILLLQPATHVTTSPTTKFHRSTDRGLNWSVVFSTTYANTNVDVDGYTSAASCGRWPYDVERVFWLENGHAFTSGKIWYTDNMFSSVNDKTGNWVAIMGANFRYPVRIIPIWIN